jgi:hypothetical protein
MLISSLGAGQPYVIQLTLLLYFVTFPKASGFVGIEFGYVFVIRAGHSMTSLSSFDLWTFYMIALSPEVHEITYNGGLPFDILRVLTSNA